MKIKLFVIISIASQFISCHRNSNRTDNIPLTAEKMPDLNGTVWSFKIAQGCVNEYHFKADSIFLYYSCEIEDTYYGKYYVKDDTLFLHEFVTAGDSLLSKDSPHHSEEDKYKVVLYKGKLKHIARYSKYNDIWKKDEFKFKDDYLYINRHH